MKEVLFYLKNLIKKDDTIVVATSGGPDSMCLLHLLCELNRELNFKIVVAHINHNLRKESLEEAEYVKKFAEENKLIFEYREIKEYNNNVESDAREKRYIYFKEIVNKYQAKYLMTAHHGDDLMETILMRLTRGSSLKGYSGFKKVTKVDNFMIIRPLITLTKKEITDYMDTNNFKYFVDKSNFSRKYTRNRYRLDALPFFKKENKNVKKIVFDAIPSILLIVIVIGGILTGLFTAIEASAICVVYSLFLSLIYHRTLKLKELPQIMIEAVEMTGVIMFLIAASSAMSFTMSFIKIPDALSSFVLSISDNPIIILLIINIILLLIGTVMDISPAILIFTPIFLPIVTELGVDPIHYGMFLILNLCIGTITPPVGTGLFVGASVGNVKIEHLIKPLIPFYIAIFILLMIITFVPQISLFLPRLLGL